MPQSPTELSKFGKGIFTVGKNLIVVDRRSICFDMLHLDPSPSTKTKGNIVLFSLQDRRQLQISVLYDKTVIFFPSNCY